MTLMIWKSDGDSHASVRYFIGMTVLFGDCAALQIPICRYAAEADTRLSYLISRISYLISQISPRGGFSLHFSAGYAKITR